MAPANPQRPSTVPASAELEHPFWVDGGRDAKGKRKGSTRYWSMDGRLDAEVTFVAGERHGTTTMFRPDGSVSARSEYVDGQANGPHEERHPNGKPAVRGSMRDDQRDGVWMQWFADGTLRRETTYAGGVRVRSTEYNDNGTLSLRQTFTPKGKQLSSEEYDDDGALIESVHSDDQGRPVLEERPGARSTWEYDARGLVRRSTVTGSRILSAERDRTGTLRCEVRATDGAWRVTGALDDERLVGPWTFELGGETETHDLSGARLDDRVLAIETLADFERLRGHGRIETLDRLKLARPAELAGVDKIKWARLGAAYQQFTARFPQLLAALAAPDATTRRLALGMIVRECEHQETVYPVTAQVTPFLVRLLAHPSVDRDQLLGAIEMFVATARPRAAKNADARAIVAAAQARAGTPKASPRKTRSKATPSSRSTAKGAKATARPRAKPTPGARPGAKTTSRSPAR